MVNKTHSINGTTVRITVSKSITRLELKEVKAGHREILMKRKASSNDEKELSFLWWENGTENERNARRSMLPTINEFFRHRIPYVHAKSNLWKGPVWLKLPPDLCLIRIIDVIFPIH